MCLLISLHKVVPGFPLVLAANRDEFLARPAVPMAVLQPDGPRILGGRDLLAGGTWLAANEHGVVAGLTNLPSPERDPSKRSRGELPIALAGHASAAAAAGAFLAKFDPGDFNPAWILVGDRHSLHYIDFTGGGEFHMETLPEGIHVLENKPLGEPSEKARFVRWQFAHRYAGMETVAALRSVLAGHQIPPDLARNPGPRPLAVEAACVHAGEYGTRSTAIVLVPDSGLPRFLYTEGPPCQAAEFLDAAAYWSVGLVGGPGGGVAEGDARPGGAG